MSGSATHEIPHNLWNRNDHCRLHEMPSQLTHSTQNHPTLFNIRFNIIHPPAPMSSWPSLPYGFSHQNSVCISRLPFEPHTPQLAASSYVGLTWTHVINFQSHVASLQHHQSPPALRVSTVMNVSAF
jgi:hypothetical protein